jgi:RHS repeat-associated protein
VKAFTCLRALLILVACVLPTISKAAHLDPRLGKAIDLQIQAGLMSLTLERDVAMPKLTPGAFGSQWRSNWENHLTRDREGGQIVIEDGAAIATFYLIANPPNTYASLNGETLVFAASGTAERKWNGIADRYDRAGRLVERDYGNGNRFTVTYSPQGRLTRVQGPRQTSIDLTYDSNGRIIRAAASTGESSEYSYRGDALAQVSVNGGAPTRYAYDARGALVRVEDPATGATAIEYDPRFRVTAYRYADGQSRRYEYDDARRIERQIDAAGAVTEFQVSADGKRLDTTAPGGLRMSTSFDDLGRMVNVSAGASAGATIAYNANGRMASLLQSSGAATKYEYDPATGRLSAVTYPDGRREQLVYDAAGHLTGIRVGNRQVSSYSYNPDGAVASLQQPGTRLTRYQYDAQGRLTSETDATGGVTRYQYDQRGNLTAETNPLGGVTRTVYDSQNRPISKTDPVGAVTRYSYDGGGHLKNVTLPDGGIRTTSYDARGRRISTTDEAGRTSKYEYDPAGRMTKIVNAAGHATSYRYDTSGNLVEIASSTGTAVRIERDPAGRIIRKTSAGQLAVNFSYNPEGEIATASYSDGRRYSWERDLAGRPLRVSSTVGSEAYEYDSFGNQIARVDARGNRTSYTYSPAGALTKIAMPAGNTAEYSYDEAGRVISAVRPGAPLAATTYDAMGNAITISKPFGGKTRVERNLASRVVAAYDELNQVTRFVYDASGRVSEKILPGDIHVRYRRDSLGRIVEADDGKFPMRYTYDLAGHTTRVEYVAILQSISYEYDAQGRLTRTVRPDVSVSYRYNADNLLTSLSFGSSSILFGHDAAGRITSIGYPNGVTASRSYDRDGQLSGIAYRGPSGQDLAAWTYRFDNAGNRVERTGSGAAKYEYDAAGQLISEIRGAEQTRYSYAPGGNRTAVTRGRSRENYRYGANGLLEQAGSKSYTYDAGGRVTAVRDGNSTTSFTYGADGYLASVTAGAQITTFRHAPTGERITREEGGKTSWFVYDGQDLVMEIDAENGPSASYIYGPGVDFPLAMIRGGQTYFYLSDEIGSVRHVTDASGKIVATYDYDAFGVPTQTTGNLENPFRYTGREIEPALGCYFLRARYYDFALGRFLEPDPLWNLNDDPIDLNPYLYARNNPVAFRDPTGAVAVNGLGPEDLNKLSDEDLVRLRYDNDPDWAIQRDIANDLMVKRGLIPAGDPSKGAAKLATLEYYRNILQKEAELSASNPILANDLRNRIRSMDQRIDLKKQVLPDSPTPATPNSQPRTPTLAVRGGPLRGNTVQVNPDGAPAGADVPPPARPPGEPLVGGTGAGGRLLLPPPGGVDGAAGAGGGAAPNGPPLLTSGNGSVRKLDGPPEGVILEGRKVGNKWTFEPEPPNIRDIFGSGVLLVLAVAQCEAEGYSHEACALRMGTGAAMGIALTKLLGAQLAQKLGVGLSLANTTLLVTKADVEIIKMALDAAREQAAKKAREGQQKANASDLNRESLLRQMTLLRAEVERVEKARQLIERRLRKIDQSLDDAGYKNPQDVADTLRRLKGIFDNARNACGIISPAAQRLRGLAITADTQLQGIRTQLGVGSQLSRRCGSDQDLRAAKAARDIGNNMASALSNTNTSGQDEFNKITDAWPNAELGLNQLLLASGLDREMLDKIKAGRKAVMDAQNELPGDKADIDFFRPDALRVRRSVENWKNALNIDDFTEPLKGQIIELGFSGLDLEKIDPDLASLEAKAGQAEESLDAADRARTDVQNILTAYGSALSACGPQTPGDRTPQREQKLLDRVKDTAANGLLAMNAAKLDTLINSCEQTLKNRQVTAMPPPSPATSATNTMPPPQAPLQLPPIPNNGGGRMPPPAAPTGPQWNPPTKKADKENMPPPPGVDDAKPPQNDTMPAPPGGTTSTNNGNGNQPGRKTPGQMGGLPGGNKGPDISPPVTSQPVVCNGGINASPNSGYAGDRFIVTVHITPPPHISKVLVRSTRLTDTELTKSDINTFTRAFRFSEGRTGSVPIIFDAYDDSGKLVCSQTTSVLSKGLKK